MKFDLREHYDTERTELVAARWAEARDAASRQALATQAAPICLLAARTMRRNRGLPTEQVPEMAADAAIGLMQAIDRWDPAKGAFGPYAYVRCRGAILDAMRVGDHLSRAHRAKLKAADAVAPEKALSLEYLADDDEGRPLIETLGCDGDIAERTAVRCDLGAAIASLPDRHRDALTSWMGGERMASIAVRLGVTEARVSQLCTEARRAIGVLDPKPYP